MSATKVGLGVLGEMYLSNSWIAWGLGPLLASGLGFFVTFLFVELLEASGFVSEKDLCYSLRAYIGLLWRSKRTLLLFGFLLYITRTKSILRCFSV